MPRHLRFDPIGCSLRSCDKRTGLFVADEILLGRVPAEFAAQQHGDIAQVAGADGSMVSEDIGYGQ